MDRNTILMGVVVGAIVPVAGFVVLEYIVKTLPELGLMRDVTVNFNTGPGRTVVLLAICCNLIPANIFKRRRLDQALRGILIPTIIYAGFWLYKYGSMLL